MLTVRDIDWTDKKFIRAGIIPFTEINGIRSYAFGIENGVAAIGDFGGHVEEDDYDALDSAIREYHEEALDVFGVLNRDMLQDCHVLVGKDTAEVLVPVYGRMSDYMKNFKALIGNNTEHEVQSITWLTSEQVLHAVKSPQTAVMGVKVFHMYIRIRDTILVNQEYI